MQELSSNQKPNTIPARPPMTCIVDLSTELSFSELEDVFRPS